VNSILSSSGNRLAASYIPRRFAPDGTPSAPSVTSPYNCRRITARRTPFHASRSRPLSPRTIPTLLSTSHMCPRRSSSRRVLRGTRDSIRTTLRLDALVMNDDGRCKLFYVGESMLRAGSSRSAGYLVKRSRPLVLHVSRSAPSCVPRHTGHTTAGRPYAAPRAPRSAAAATAVVAALHVQR
jgi:hypothetical protein